MPNSAFEGLLIEHFEKFKMSFSVTSTKLFVNSNGRISHPGEYGAFREAVSKDFLKLLVPQNLNIGKGFLITGKNKISTECDIVIYDKDNTPLLQSDERQRFYPIETVCAVGEVKSTLSKANFKNAINKLAAIKLFRLDIAEPSFIKRDVSKSIPYAPSSIGYDNIFTFLICKKLDFDYSNLAEEIDNLYDVNLFHYQKHNLILSIDDGVLLYYFEDPNSDSRKSLYYPFFSNKELKHRFIFPHNNQYTHLKMFASYIFAGVSSSTIIFPNIIDYMGAIDGGVQIDKR